MYAVIEAGGRQWKVEPGTQFEINRITTEVGSPHTLERVLLAHDGAALQIGRPYLEGAKVVCEVVAHRLGVKTISYHFRRRENWRKTVGHRQPLTRLLVKDILLGNGQTLAAAHPATASPKARAQKTAVPKAAARKPSVKKEKIHGA